MNTEKQYKSITGLESLTDRLAVSPSEGARMLGISKPKMYEIMRQENFPAFKLGSRTLISVDGLRQWVADQAGVKVG